METYKAKMIEDFSCVGQQEYIRRVKQITDLAGHKQYACIVTYGCQQNVSDSEKIAGMLKQMGYDFCDKAEMADFVIFNTCAVREHAELKVYGNVGALKPIKKNRPQMKIAVCGCMMQQENVIKEIKSKYPHVDIVFGPSLIYKLPQMLYNCLSDGVKCFDNSQTADIIENMPVLRTENGKAWVTVMYGCNNFCTYCIVPYLRGRERSRKSEDIINEIKALISHGYKDITLLGQNVNSYGKDLEQDIDFSDLLYKINELKGDFWIRFITSHPKDCTFKLIDTIAGCDKVAKQLQLPFQAGSDRVLKAMNRGYSSSDYLKLISYAKQKIDDLVITSDVIVGFPGESYDEFMDTIKLVKQVEFDNLFTFLYSKRKGTPAADMDNQIDHAEKQRRFDKLLKVQSPISLKNSEKYVGKQIKVFVEGVSKTDKNVLTARTNGGKLVNFKGDKSLIGDFANIKIISAKTWYLVGEYQN